MVITETLTRLGYRDVSESLRSGNLTIRKLDVVKGILTESEHEQTHDDGSISFVHYFKSEEYHMRGRLFPLDELIVTNYPYDIIIQNLSIETRPLYPLNVDSQVYHDFYPGEQLAVRISRIRQGNDPSFKLFNHITGFVKDRNSLYSEIQEQDVLAVEVENLTDNRGRLIVHVRPLEIIIPAQGEIN